MSRPWRRSSRSMFWSTITARLRSPHEVLSLVIFKPDRSFRIIIAEEIVGRVRNQKFLATFFPEETLTTPIMTASRLFFEKVSESFFVG